MVKELGRLDIAETIKEIKRHRLEDMDFWVSLLGTSDPNSKTATILARCMGERSMLLRLMGHLPPIREGK